MTYSQSKALFEAMDNLETYSKMYALELRKDHTEYDHESANRYQAYIEVARSKIFNLMEQSQ